MSIVTVEDLKAHLNITTTDDDALLAAKIAVAEALVALTVGYALDDADAFPTGTPEPLKEAVRQAVGWLYNEREGGAGLPAGVYALIEPYRQVVV